jgi:phospholipid/cholesterol/gamma-HCH transport system substrate-binding protein
VDTKKIQIAVGLFIVISFAALSALAIKVSNINEYNNSESYLLAAHFDNIGGLKIRSAVKVGGVVVGRITGIDLDTKTMSPIVTMKINSKYNAFSSETSAAILTAGLLGEQYISLTPGGDDKLLADGGEILDTQSALILEDLIGQFLFSKGSQESL